MKIEQIYHVGVKAIIYNPNNDILILKRTDRDYWDLPGGRIQEGEKVDETLFREIREETGLIALDDITPHGLYLTSIRFPVNDQSIGLIFYYHTCRIAKEDSIILSPEHNDFKWSKIEEAKTLLSYDFTNFCDQQGL
jgi:8-oxo-dGTP pyrophosphatase MutT (NUDIX family)